MKGWEHDMADVKKKGINISANTVDEFMAMVHKALKRYGKQQLGHTSALISRPTEKYDKKNKISQLRLKVEYTIEYGHWSSGKPNANNKKAIETIEERTLEHENKHQKDFQEICDSELPNAEFTLMGKSKADLKTKINEIEKQMEKKRRELDAREGTLVVTDKRDGSFDIKFAPSK
jgi:hypothetical protein